MSSVSGTLYIGVTNDLERRVYEHKNDLIEGFTKKYQCHTLVYAEDFVDIHEAISREKQLKGWNRKKKEKLINALNSKWQDLSVRWNLNVFQ